MRLRFGPGARAQCRDPRHPHHLLRDYAYDESIGEVVAHPSRPDLWGIRNLSGRIWRIKSADGTTTQDVSPGRSVGLVVGSTIDFGRVTATIEA